MDPAVVAKTNNNFIPKVLLQAKKIAEIQISGKEKSLNNWDKAPWDKGHWANRK